MSAPQIKERPASMLRAMFAGFGSLMSVMDKVRPKPAAEAPAGATTPAPEDTAAQEEAAPAAVAPEPVTAETASEAAPSAAAETVAAEATDAAQATVVAETTAVPQDAAVAETVVDAETIGELPVANYDELSVASLRARLRNLTNDDLTQLMTYERANQNRPEVVKMFQNRLIKMTSGLPKLVE